MRDYPHAGNRKKIGHITPSSNTVLETMTGCVNGDIDHLVSHHYTRIAVEAISLEPRHTEQFSADRMLGAASLLADAAVDAIIWNGTSGAWNGIAADVQLCELIEQQTATPASTSTLAQLEAMDAWGVERCGLAVPYAADVTERIAETYGAAGYEVVSRSYDGGTTNRDFAYITDDRIRDLVRRADSPEAQCVLVVCTGAAAAHLVAELEQEIGKPIIDSVSVCVWKAMQMVGVSAPLAGWGYLLDGMAIAPGVESP